MSSSRKTASVTAVVRSSLYESLLEKLSSEHQALLSELGSARQETVRFERQVKHQFSEMKRIQQMVSELEKRHNALRGVLEAPDSVAAASYAKCGGRKRARANEVNGASPSNKAAHVASPASASSSSSSSRR